MLFFTLKNSTVNLYGLDLDIFNHYKITTQLCLFFYPLRVIVNLGSFQKVALVEYVTAVLKKLDLRLNIRHGRNSSWEMSPIRTRATCDRF